jgi:hypothetical protein
MNLKYLTTGVLLIAGVCGWADSVEDCLFTAQRDGKESGSGFLLKEQDRTWMVSNCHVVQGSNEVRFVGMRDAGKVYNLPDTIEVAKDRDAVRFQVPADLNGLLTASDCSFDEAVRAYGNSGGAGVITKSAGTVIGKGRDEVEVSCEIVPGNSGGPVLNTNDQIVGIASFIIKAPKSPNSSRISASERSYLERRLETVKGTRYEKTRRFAIPIADAEWQSVALPVFKTESGIYGKIDEDQDRFFAAVSAICQVRLLSEKYEDLFPRRWVREYNRMLEEHGYFTTGGLSIYEGKSDSFKRRYSRCLKEAGTAAETLAGQIQGQADLLTVNYFKEQIKKKAEYLSRAGQEIADAAVKVKP